MFALMLGSYPLALPFCSRAHGKWLARGDLKAPLTQEQGQHKTWTVPSDCTSYGGEAVNRGSGKSLLLLVADGVWCVTTSEQAGLCPSAKSFPPRKFSWGGPKLEDPHVTACSSHLLPGKPHWYNPPLPREPLSKEIGRQK